MCVTAPREPIDVAGQGETRTKRKAKGIEIIGKTQTQLPGETLVACLCVRVYKVLAWDERAPTRVRNASHGLQGMERRRCFLYQRGRALVVCGVGCVGQCMCRVKGKRVDSEPTAWPRSRVCFIHNHHWLA